MSDMHDAPSIHNAAPRLGRAADWTNEERAEMNLPHGVHHGPKAIHDLTLTPEEAALIRDAYFGDAKAIDECAYLIERIGNAADHRLA